ncbi:DUF896 domain-containing protein [Planococcus kocurii]|uniref:UPF0291 protein AUO94_02870 n=2 Tax=Planococcus TaxID=1372 RepID=A0ABN4JSC6_9BACL|nr:MULTISPECIES: DUF896 domain-containing protein [Planococcus]ALS77649.1 hypothetical protein AUO94_02870 [Planococcus kocurii]AQU80451.1 DUF896 family protein [Planococcus faecalis]KAA0958969.1 DUF896 domain-containing protein [Planococcus sp. ANT_H30]OHX54789.1 hypothetical protein BB777_05470 [Planococcus faecalis]
MIDSLPRINQLAKKAREEGLTNAEKVEQQVLREDYLRSIRGQVESTVTSMTVIDPLGEDVTPEKVRTKKENNLIIESLN